MLRPKTTLLAAVIGSGLFACADEGPTAIPRATASPAGLALSLPGLDPAVLVDRSAAVHSDPARPGPRLVDEADGGEEEQPAEIFYARTISGFIPGGAIAEGSHRFHGHAGRIETTAEVRFDGRVIGSQTGVKEESWWLSLQVLKDIATYVRVYAEPTCGLEVRASSRHSAWWELFSGKAAPRWGHAEAASWASPVSQGPCGHEIVTRDPTGTYRHESGIVCFYLITYDLETLEIVDVQYLSCEASQGPEI